MQHIIEKIAVDHNLKRRNGKYVGSCPECGGSGKSDKFNIRDDGGFKCYSCDFKGDIITWLRKKEGMSCPQAHEAAGKDCGSTSCTIKSTCRVGGGSGHRQYRPRSVSPVAQSRQQLAAADVTDPKEKWQIWAVSLLEQAQKQLVSRKSDLSWLAGRGIDAAAVARFGLGWLGKNSKVDRTSIGLLPRDDKKPHLWVPDGLLIPIFDDNGKLHRLRVRRSEQSRKRFLPDLKYVWLEGAGTAPLSIRPAQGKIRGVVIVEAELDAMAVASSHNQVLVVALGTVRAGLPADLRAKLAKLPVILVSLDADPGKDGATGAGPQAIAAWTREFRQAKFWPVPDGKDPGHYAQLSGDLHAWIEAGLVPEPPKPVQSSPAHAKNLSPECNSSRGAGAVSSSLVREIELTNGRVFYVVDDRAAWDRLVAEGKAVFSENELQRLKQATSGMAAADRLEAAGRILDMKETFNSAYIRRGECFG